MMEVFLVEWVEIGLLSVVAMIFGLVVWGILASEDPPAANAETERLDLPELNGFVDEEGDYHFFFRGQDQVKICVVSSTVFTCPPPGYAGLEMIAWQQAKGLAEKGHEVSLVAPDGSSCPGVTVIPCGPAGGWDERRAWMHYKHLLPGFDVVADHSWQKWTYVSKMKEGLRVPVVGILHAPTNTMYTTLPPVEKPSIVCISEDQGEHFRSIFNRSCRVVHNGIDLDFYKPTGCKRTDRYLFLARFSSIKGPDIAIDVANATGVGLDLVGDTSITGEPGYYEACKARCDGTRVKIIGPASRGECVHWYSQSRAFLHPNARFREPLGLAPLEAQACGNPVLCFDVGAMRETVKYGETGFLVKTVEEFADLIRCRALDGLDRSRCREWASQFSIDRMVRGYENALTEAVETGGW